MMGNYRNEIKTPDETDDNGDVITPGFVIIPAKGGILDLGFKFNFN